jgi:hypothetical protein
VTFPYECTGWQRLDHFVKDPPPKPNPADRPNGVAAFFSDCNDLNQARFHLMKALMQHVQIDSFGKCFHNKDDGSNRQDGNYREAKRETLKGYRMYALVFTESLQ